MDKQVALITGASKGIGKAIALKLAKNQYNLVISGRNKEQLAETAHEAEKNNIHTLIVPADLNEEHMYRTIIEKTMDKFGKLNHLINNAGYALSRSVENTKREEWDAIMQINAKAPFFICKNAIQYLQKESHSTIINISSVVGHQGYENQAAYSASKHALNGFTKALAKEIQPYGINVHLIEPGGVNTNLVQDMRPDLDSSILIHPEEIADIALFLISMKGNAVIDEIKVRRQNGTPWK